MSNNEIAKIRILNYLQDEINMDEFVKNNAYRRMCLCSGVTRHQGVMYIVAGFPIFTFGKVRGTFISHSPTGYYSVDILLYLHFIDRVSTTTYENKATDC